MVALLTVYFWSLLILMTVTSLVSLFRPVVAVPPDQRGCAAEVWVLATTPLIYLQSVALPTLGLPSWLAWGGLAWAILAVACNEAKVMRYTGGAFALPLLSFAVAWHGLQVLRGAA
ncbi:hypothetical protein [Deinococcus rufus]|uniref:Uncharacterized protein n=1 Tax=Deinococcus rufus TaxID=2136097 RepID=A0ABV7Z824_9DEIO